MPDDASKIALDAQAFVIALRLEALYAEKNLKMRQAVMALVALGDPALTELFIAATKERDLLHYQMIGEALTRIDELQRELRALKRLRDD